MIADAANNATDLISDGVTATAVTMARLPADDVHPFGKGAAVRSARHAGP